MNRIEYILKQIILQPGVDKVKYGKSKILHN